MNRNKRLPNNLKNRRSIINITSLVDLDGIEIDEEVQKSMISPNGNEVSNDFTLEEIIYEEVKEIAKEENTVIVNEKKPYFWSNIIHKSPAKEAVKEEFKEEVKVEAVSVVEEIIQNKEEIKMSENQIKESAIISSSMVVKGDLELESALVLNGKVFGNITCKDLVESSVGSFVEGNIESKALKLNGAELNGNVVVEDFIEANEQSKIIGNIKANRAIISGTVEGEIKTDESLVVKSSAIIKGDIESASISIEAGAKLQGKVTIS